MYVDVLLGLQWGDEGKGKIVDYLAHNYDVVARFQGGPNAGHTLYYKGRKIVLHNIPSGVFHEQAVNLAGNGMVLDPVSMQHEAEEVLEVGIDIYKKLYLSRKAHLILPSHRMLDAASEADKGKQKIGSTLRGIAPTYMDKVGRNALRVGDIELPDFKERYEELKAKHQRILDMYGYECDFSDLEAQWWESIEFMRGFQTVNGEYFINEQLRQGKKVLAEGAQGSMLDIDFGTYPFVTSSNTITSGVCNGLGIAPHKIRKVYGVTKAYCTRVGAGPFPTELADETGERIRQEGGEFGATTGRPRACGWIDLPALKYAIMLNGVTDIVMTKIDVLSILESVKACTQYIHQDGTKTDELPYDLARQAVTPHYETRPGWQEDVTQVNNFFDLPASLREYIAFVEDTLNANITLLSVGPNREQLIDRAMDSLIA